MQEEFIEIDVRAKDISGQTFHDLAVLGPVGRYEKNGQIIWLCQCACGTRCRQVGSQLRNGAVKSCGCRQVKSARKTMTTHGMSRSPEYNSWHMMIQRCTNPNYRSFPRYGGRGIVVCERWRNSFEKFLEDMGSRPDGTSLDRIDNDGPYSPENCRWATRAVQNRNSSRNRFLVIQSVRMTVADWCDVFGVPRGTVGKRLRKGWSDAEVVFGRGCGHAPLSSATPVSG